MLRSEIRVVRRPKQEISPPQATSALRHNILGYGFSNFAVSGALQPLQVASSPETEQEPIADSVEANDLLFLQLLANSLDIPQVNLPEKFGVQGAAPRWNRHPDQGAPYTLGTGASCTVVQHETDEETSDVVPPGTLVALKRYKHKKHADSAADRDLAHIIWQDIRVLWHPQLRGHENICQLLFIGWDDHSIVPSLVLELAAFGSLRDALESEFSLSWLQKCHISFDITIGLCTLHSCGLLHGDLKPENVMIQHHENRQIVAKLLDFAGATDETRFGSGQHRRFMSKLWLPAEALVDGAVVDWRKVDCYSYGMLITHIFCDLDFETTNCYLETSIPNYFTAAEKDDMLLYFKTCPETTTDSVLSQSMELTTKQSQDLRSQDIMIPLEFVQKRTLTVDPQTRAGLDEIMPFFRPFAEARERVFPTPVDTVSALQQEQTVWRRLAGTSFFVFDDELSQRSDLHQRSLLEYMIQVSGPPVLTNGCFEVGAEADFLDPNTLELLLFANNNHRLSPPDYYNRKIHYQIALCYIMGRGTEVDEREGLRFLASAALGRVRRAMNMYTAVEESAEIVVDWNMPRQLLLCLGYLDGCTICADILSNRHPQTYYIVNRLRHSLGVPLWRVLCSSGSETVGKAESRIDEGRSIFERIDAEDVAGVKELLCLKPDVELIHESGMTALHALSLITDQFAAVMAPLLLDHGADLSHEAAEHQTSSTNGLTFGWGTPIIWSIMKSKPKLFAAFLDWCAQKQVELPAGNASVFLVTIAHRQSEMLQKLLGHKLTFKEEGKDMSSSHYQSAALLRAVEEVDSKTVMRRWSLGGLFRSSRRAIAELLVSMDLELLGGAGMRENPVRLAILEGDAVCLSVYLQALEGRGHHLRELLSRDGLLRNGKTKSVCMSALYASTLAPSPEAMHYLLGHFPELIDQQSAAGWTPLHRITSQGRQPAVLRLLDHQANIYHRTDKGANVLVIALSHNAIDIANILIHRGDKVRLVGGDSATEPTALYLILETYLSGRRSVAIESFEFLRRIGGLTFTPNVKTQDTVWRTILMRGRPYLEDHVSADITLLRFFLRPDVFGNKVDDIDWTGRAALHYAARYGYLEALELFIKSGASINIETQFVADSEGTCMTRKGLTPTDIALYGPTTEAPKRILAGGAIEIRSWQSRMSRTLKVLVDNGGEIGSGAPSHHYMQLAKVREPEAFRRLAIHTMKPIKGDQTWRGKWPERIPRCPSLPPDAKNEILPKSWPERYGKGGSDESASSTDSETAQMQTIVYRTANGKKYRLTDLELRVVSSLIDSPSEGEETTKNHMYNRLRIAQAFIAPIFQSEAPEK